MNRLKQWSGFFLFFFSFYHQSFRCHKPYFDPLVEEQLLGAWPHWEPWKWGWVSSPIEHSVGFGSTTLFECKNLTYGTSFPIWQCRKQRKFKNLQKQTKTKIKKTWKISKKNNFSVKIIVTIVCKSINKIPTETSKLTPKCNPSLWS